MAGVKDRSGLKKGRTNNPNGRPVGSKNKVNPLIREKIEKYLADDWDNLVETIGALDPKDSVRAKIDLMKMVVPRPVSEEEREGVNQLYGGLAHLFGRTEGDK